MKEYRMVLDCETTNTPRNEKGQLDTSSSQAYDLGGSVIDDEGNVYEDFSVVNSDVFYNNEMMKNAYYADKIPQYKKEIAEGKRKVVNTWGMWKTVDNLLKKYNITTVIAHNARFDVAALNATMRYQTKSKKRYFFRYGTQIWDTMKMSAATICKDEEYVNFCKSHDYMTGHPKPRVRKTDEILWQFLTKNDKFCEEHTGLEDVKIERAIYAECVKRKQEMEREANLEVGDMPECCA